MIDICLVGGLGNQMFQFALYKSFEARGMPVKMFRLGSDTENIPAIQEVFPRVTFQADEGSEEYQRLEALDRKRPLPVRALGRLMLSQKKVIEETNEGTLDRRIFGLKDAALIGYWQTSRYWTGLEETIRNAFSFRQDKDCAAELLNRVAGSESVSVHIRGGDYHDEENRKIFGGICTPAYYRRAMDQMREMKKTPLFYVFTNDLPYAKQVTGENGDCVFVAEEIGHKYPDWVDLMLMSRCRHNIIANSSFSWWGAWLNRNPEKTAIAPAKWLNTKPTEDIWEPGWLRIGSE